MISEQFSYSKVYIILIRPTEARHEDQRATLSFYTCFVINQPQSLLAQRAGWPISAILTEKYDYHITTIEFINEVALQARVHP
jgi:hypothetical protein